jgi:ketosteroid isomerase-like protein
VKKIKQKFMTNLIRISTVVALVIASALALSAQDKEKNAVEQLVRDQIAAQTAYDRAKLDQITTKDYIEISPLGEFDERAKMLDFYKPELKPLDLNVKTELKDFSTRVNKDHAISIVRIDYAMSSRGQAFPTRSIRATFVCRKEGRMWRVASAHFTGIRPPQAPPQ